MVRTWGKRAASAAVAFAVVLGGCSAIGDRDDEASESLASAHDTAGIDPTTAGAAAGEHAGSVAAGGSTGPAANAVPASVAMPRVVKTATVRLEVVDGEFSKAFAEAATIASSAGGFVASSTSAAGSDDELASGSLTLRVPAESFDAVSGRLRDLGEVRSEEIAGQDVGGQIADLEARLRNLRAQEEAIRALMSRTNNVQDTLNIQGQLGGVREQIEQLDAQRARLEDQVVYATITLHLFEPGAAPKGERSSIAEAFSDAVEGAESITAGAIVALGYLLPLATVVLLALAIRRSVVRQGAPAPASATVGGSGEHGA